MATNHPLVILSNSPSKIQIASSPASRFTLGNGPHTLRPQFFSPLYSSCTMATAVHCPLTLQVSAGVPLSWWLEGVSLYCPASSKSRGREEENQGRGIPVFSLFSIFSLSIPSFSPRISLNTLTLNVKSEKVYTRHGVPISVTGIAQVRLSEPFPQSLLPHHFFPPDIKNFMNMAFPNLCLQRNFSASLTFSGDTEDT